MTNKICKTECLQHISHGSQPVFPSVSTVFWHLCIAKQLYKSHPKTKHAAAKDNL